MVNACAEVPDPAHPVHRTAAEQKAWLRGLLLRLATEAGYANPGVLADRLLILHEGAVVMYATAGMSHVTDTARDTAALLLKEAALSA